MDQQQGLAALWLGLHSAGLSEVVLYLPDGSASRCHWDDTALLNGRRVALLADQERGVVRIMPIESCLGLGIPSPKGVDPVGYRGAVRERLAAATRSGSADSADVSPADSDSRSESEPGGADPG